MNSKSSREEDKFETDQYGRRKFVVKSSINAGIQGPT